MNRFSAASSALPHPGAARALRAARSIALAFLVTIGPIARVRLVLANTACCTDTSYGAAGARALEQAKTAQAREDR